MAPGAFRSVPVFRLAAGFGVALREHVLPFDCDRRDPTAIKKESRFRGKISHKKEVTAQARPLAKFKI